VSLGHEGGVNPMGMAAANMEYQAREGNGTWISLDALWRATGSPAGMDPRSWVDLARHYIRGTARYVKALDDLRPPGMRAGLRGTIDDVLAGADEDQDFDPIIRRGDLAATYLVAWAYVLYLDDMPAMMGGGRPT
jgi:hypothetical protein